jgi:hypothetical protein
MWRHQVPRGRRSEVAWRVGVLGAAMAAVMVGGMGFVGAGRAGAAGEPDAASPALLGEPPSSTRDAPKEPGESAQPTTQPAAWVGRLD